MTVGDEPDSGRHAVEISLELPLDRSRPPESHAHGSTVTLVVDAALLARLARLGRSHAATPQSTVLAAFIVLLQRYTGETDVCLAAAVTGRECSRREEELDGFFAGALPLRVRCEGSQTFSALLESVHAAIAGGPANRRRSSQPVGGIRFEYDAPPAGAARPSAASARCDNVDPGYVQFDLALRAREDADGRLMCRFTYRRDVFEPATIESLAAHFAILLASIAASPDTALDRLELASAPEIERIIEVWGRPGPALQRLAPIESATTVHGLVEAAAARRPAAAALLEADQPPITYAQFDRRANQLAHLLRAHGVGRDVRVGLFLDRGAGALIAMLATLKAGGAYVPLDPAYPAERTSLMLEASGTQLIVTTRDRRAQAAAFARHVVTLDDDSQTGCPADVPPAGTAAPDDLAYVMFTSGSTGIPKAVAIAHRGIVALVTRTAALAFDEADTALLHGPLTFDASTFCWALLAHGGRLAIPPPGPLSLAEFGAQLERFNVSVVDLTPAMFHQLVEERLGDLRALRCCLVGGDVLSPAHAARFVQAIPACRLFNGYGPTEATVITLQHEVRPDADVARPVPIGAPIANARVYVLDARRTPVGVGVPGDLWIGGDGVAREYLNDPVLTAERFTPDPFAKAAGARMYRTGDRARWLPNGELDFLGRADAQVKIRGFRIEPAEVEFALLDHSAVRGAAVIARGATAADRQLIAYVAVRDGAAGEAALRAFLQTKLPAHAIPARIVLLPALPFTSSGKLDRSRLPDPAGPPESRSTAGEPRSPAEATLAAIVAPLLKLERIGRDDNFFGLGGDSLLATRAIARIAEAFDVDVPLRGFFESPTIAQLATLVARLPRRAAPVGDDLDRQLEALSPEELDALLRQTLEERDASRTGARLRCVIVGETTLALRCAQFLQRRGHSVVAAIVPSAFDAAQWAAEHEIPLAHSVDALSGILRGAAIDYVFSIINLRILDAATLALTKGGGINLHDGPLPRYAGRFATTFAIAAQEREHAVTWHEMSSTIDGGRILKQPRFPIESGETALSLNLKCYDAALASFAELVDELAVGRNEPRAQEVVQRTYFRLSTRPSPACIIDFDQPAAVVDAFVRALDFGPTPNPVGRPKIVLGDHVYSCRAADVLAEDAVGQPGAILRFEPDALVVATRDHALRLREFTDCTGAAISPAELRARHGLSDGRILHGWPAAVAPLIAELDVRATRNETFWLPRLAALDPLDLAAPVAGAARASGRISLPTGGGDGFLLCAAFTAALATHVASQAGDLAYITGAALHWPPPAAALFCAGLPLRVTVDAAAELEAAALDLRERCAELERRGPFARDIVARIPALRTQARRFPLPIAIAFARPDTFAGATVAGRLALLVDAEGGEAAVLFAADAQSRRAARSIADDIARRLRTVSVAG